MSKLVFFKKRAGEKVPAYSYFQNDKLLENVKNQGIVEKIIDVPEGVPMGKEFADLTTKTLQEKGELWK